MKNKWAPVFRKTAQRSKQDEVKSSRLDYYSTNPQDIPSIDVDRQCTIDPALEYNRNWHVVIID